MPHETEDSFGVLDVAKYETTLEKLHDEVCVIDTVEPLPSNPLPSDKVEILNERWLRRIQRETYTQFPFLLVRYFRPDVAWMLTVIVRQGKLFSVRKKPLNSLN